MQQLQNRRGVRSRRQGREVQLGQREVCQDGAPAAATAGAAASAAADRAPARHAAFPYVRDRRQAGQGLRDDGSVEHAGRGEDRQAHGADPQLTCQCGGYGGQVPV